MSSRLLTLLPRAANLTSINTPPHISEWDLSKLTPAQGLIVKPPFVRESPFSVECKLHSKQEIISKITGKRTATLVLAEIVQFHVWKDALSSDQATVDPSKLRPIFRAGGITYGTCLRGFELPRPEAYRNIAGLDAVKALFD